MVHFLAFLQKTEFKRTSKKKKQRTKYYPQEHVTKEKVFNDVPSLLFSGMNST